MSEIDGKRMNMYLYVSVSGLVWTMFLYQAWIDWCWKSDFNSLRIITYLCTGIVAMMIWAFVGTVIAYCVYGKEN